MKLRNVHFSGDFRERALLEFLFGSFQKSNKFQPAPKYHTKGCSHSSADSPGARTLVFAAFESFHSCEFRASIVRTPFCAILWRCPKNHRFLLQIPLINPLVFTLPLFCALLTKCAAADVQNGFVSKNASQSAIDPVRDWKGSSQY